MSSSSAPWRAVPSGIAAWRPGVLACLIGTVAVGLNAGWPEVALGIAASAGVILHRYRVVSAVTVLLLLASAAAVATAVVFLDVRAAFGPYGLGDLAPAATVAFLLARIVPLAGAMAVLALDVRIGGLPVGASLLAACGVALAAAVAACSAGMIVAIGGGLVAGGDLGVISSHLAPLFPSRAPVLYAAPALPLLVWLGVRLRGPCPVLCAIAATLLAMRL